MRSWTIFALWVRRSSDSSITGSRMIPRRNRRNDRASAPTSPLVTGLKLLGFETGEIVVNDLRSSRRRAADPLRLAFRKSRVASTAHRCGSGLAPSAVARYWPGATEFVRLIGLAAIKVVVHDWNPRIIEPQPDAELAALGQLAAAFDVCVNDVAAACRISTKNGAIAMIPMIFRV